MNPKKSWTRTLNLTDAHTLIALAEPRMPRADWEARCYEALAHISKRPRQTGMIRLVRDTCLLFTSDGRIDGRGLFLRIYREAPAPAQEELLRAAWALSHGITQKALNVLVVGRGLDTLIPLDDFDAFVVATLDTKAPDALRKTRTTLLDALDGLGCVETRGTGRHRSIRVASGTPHPVVFAYLILRELCESNRDGMLTTDATSSSLAMAATGCSIGHAFTCIGWALQTGALVAIADEIAMPEAIAA